MTVGGLQHVMTNSRNHSLPAVAIEVNDGLLETTSASGKALGSKLLGHSLISCKKQFVGYFGD